MSIHNIHVYHFQYKKENYLNYPKSVAMGFFQGLENELETIVVNVEKIVVRATEVLLYALLTMFNNCLRDIYMIIT